jgi:hypothetical protein
VELFGADVVEIHFLIFVVWGCKGGGAFWCVLVEWERGGRACLYLLWGVYFFSLVPHCLAWY